MVAQQITKNTLPYLRLSDSKEMAIDLMLENKCLQLAVVDELDNFKGLVDLENLLDNSLETKVLADLEKKFLDVFVYPNAQLSEILSKLKMFNLSLLPILDENQKLVSTISQQDLMDYFAQISASNQPGGILVLEMGYHDFSLSQIARIAENNNASILSSFVTNPSNSLNILVTLKFNLIDLSRVIAGLERYDYKIVYQQHESNLSDFYDDRYNALMNYLNT